MSRIVALRRLRAARFLLAAMGVWGLAHAAHALSHAFPFGPSDLHHSCAHHAHPGSDDTAPDSSDAAHDEDAACAFCDTDLGPLHGDLLPVALRVRQSGFPDLAASHAAACTRPRTPQPARGPPART